jgi:hypothetical protein
VRFLGLESEIAVSMLAKDGFSAEFAQDSRSGLGCAWGPAVVCEIHTAWVSVHQFYSLHDDLAYSSSEERRFWSSRSKFQVSLIGCFPRMKLDQNSLRVRNQVSERSGDDCFYAHFRAGHPVLGSVELLCVISPTASVKKPVS